MPPERRGSGPGLAPANDAGVARGPEHGAEAPLDAGVALVAESDAGGPPEAIGPSDTGLRTWMWPLRAARCRSRPSPGDLPLDIVARSALPLHALEGERVLSEAQLSERRAGAPATCLGEVHDNPADHYARLRALEELARRAREAGESLALGFEMFQRPFQAVLTSFVEGLIDEAGLLQGTQ